MKGRTARPGEIFGTFFKIGAFTFGGGYAMIPLIEKETVQKHGWVSEQDILDIVAIAESTPGPIAINAATFVGYRAGGTGGALMATLGVALPSFLVILLISAVLQQFEDLKLVQYAFDGIRAGVLALIVKALASMYRQCPKDRISLLIAAGAFLLSVFSGVNTLLIIAGCAAAGLIRTLAGKGEKA